MDWSRLFETPNQKSLRDRFFVGLRPSQNDRGGTTVEQRHPQPWRPSLARGAVEQSETEGREKNKSHTPTRHFVTPSLVAANLGFKPFARRANGKFATLRLLFPKISLCCNFREPYDSATEDGKGRQRDVASEYLKNNRFPCSACF